MCVSFIGLENFIITKFKSDSSNIRDLINNKTQNKLGDSTTKDQTMSFSEIGIILKATHNKILEPPQTFK
jgi:hypothetical protein